MDDKRCMQFAIEQARLAKDSGEWPFGAVILFDGSIVAQNHCAETNEKNILAHAELRTLHDACQALGRKNLNDCIIYCSNEPCLMCAAAIFQAKIPRVVIGASRSDLPHLLRDRKLRIEDVAQDSGYDIEIIRGVCREDVLELFENIEES